MKTDDAELIDVDKKLRKDINKCHSILLEHGDDSKQFKATRWYVYQKYLLDIRITPKGTKTITSLLKRFWDGMTLSKKELLMIYGMGMPYMISMEPSNTVALFMIEITKELKQYDIDIYDIEKFGLSEHLSERGMVESNPYYSTGFHDALFESLGDGQMTQYLAQLKVVFGGMLKTLEV